MADLGRAALVVTLGLAVYALVAGAVAARENRRRLAASARNALYCSFASTLVAAAVLAVALVRHDFSFRYVAAHTNRHLPVAYAVSGFWGGQEGSLLLWLLVLTGFGGLAVALNRNLLRELTAWVVPVLGGIASFFAFVLVAVASPFDTQTATVDGAGLTPSLQNPYMVAHPPMLYLGYVGLSIPFAFAAGAMLSGRTDERWIVATRRWTLAAWTFLDNNLLLVALCLTVLWGVLFPIVTQLVKGETRTIGRPYYDFFLRSFGLPLLLLMGIGPLIAWRKTSVRALARTLAWPGAVTVACGVALVALGAGSSRPGLIAYTFSAFVLAAIVLRLVRGTGAPGSLATLVSRNRRRYGGYVVHAAIVLLAIGIAGSSAYGS